MTPYQAMLHEGVPAETAAKVIALLEEQAEPTTWTPAPERVTTARRKDDDAFAERLRVREEAYRLLDLVAMEFKTDPMSVQCFDGRIVDRVIYIAALTKAGMG